MMKRMETTLNHNGTDGCEEDFNDRCHDPDYEEEPVSESFSLSYMKRAIIYYDAINPKTGQRGHKWRNVQSKFKKIPHQSYMAHFRRYVEEGGTKKRKVDSLNDYVYNNFERPRGLICPVHDMDLKRWPVRETRFMSFYNFMASDICLLNFKHMYNICSRKISLKSRRNFRILFYTRIMIFFLFFSSGYEACTH